MYQALKYSIKYQPKNVSMGQLNCHKSTEECQQ